APLELPVRGGPDAGGCSQYPIVGDNSRHLINRHPRGGRAKRKWHIAPAHLAECAVRFCGRTRWDRFVVSTLSANGSNHRFGMYYSLYRDAISPAKSGEGGQGMNQ